MIEINCAAIPGPLGERELFGYERGAYTDARAAKPGLLEAAEGSPPRLSLAGQRPGAGACHGVGLDEPERSGIGWRRRPGRRPPFIIIAALRWNHADAQRFRG